MELRKPRKTVLFQRYHIIIYITFNFYLKTQYSSVPMNLDIMLKTKIPTLLLNVFLTFFFLT